VKFYIATKLENHLTHNGVRDELLLHGHEITYDWTTHGSVQETTLERIREVAELEANGVIDCDVCIVLWPGGRGTHVELGMAIALGKTVVFVSDVIDHHHATRETCAFYHHPSVIRCCGFSEMWDAVRGITEAATP
jgi:nucleoside 2-deoxyribosyltransferase